MMSKPRSRVSYCFDITGGRDVWERAVERRLMRKSYTQFDQ